MKKRILAISLIVAMLAIAVIGGSLAYFTDTDDAVNTFTVGNVDIELTEPNYVEDNQIVMPSKTIAKDPTITVAPTSQPAWICLQMEIGNSGDLTHLMWLDAKKANLFNGTFEEFMAKMGGHGPENNAFRATVAERWFQGINHDDWKLFGVYSADDSEMVIDLGYQVGPVAPGNSIKFMESFTMPETITSDMLRDYPLVHGEEQFRISFIAWAIQAEGIDSISDAHTSLGYTNP